MGGQHQKSQAYLDEQQRLSQLDPSDPSLTDEQRTEIEQARQSQADTEAQQASTDA